MRRDEDIERLLEEHLADTARPMPQEVLENAIEATARTRQMRPGRVTLPWFRPIPGAAMMAVAGALLIVAIGLGIDRLGLIQGGGVGSRPTPVPDARTWDATNDFRIGGAARNPSADSYGNEGVWSYLVTATEQLHEPSAYTPLPDYGDQPLEEAWTDVSWRYLGVGVSKPDGIVRMMTYVGADGSFAPVLSWRSPMAGTVRMQGTVSMAHRDCPARDDGVTFWVDREGETLESRRLLPESADVFDLAVDVEGGESLYFILDPGPSSDCDETDVELQITTP